MGGEGDAERRCQGRSTPISTLVSASGHRGIAILGGYEALHSTASGPADTTGAGLATTVLHGPRLGVHLLYLVDPLRWPGFRGPADAFVGGSRFTLVIGGATSASRTRFRSSGLRSKETSGFRPSQPASVRIRPMQRVWENRLPFSAQRLVLAAFLVGGPWACSSHSGHQADGSVEGTGGSLGNGGTGGGSAQDGPPRGLGGAPGSGGQFVAGGGGGAGGTSGSAGQSGGGTTSNNTGAIMVYQMAGNRSGAPYSTHGATATFSNTPKTTPDCTTTIIAPCTITICNLYGVVGGPDAGSTATLPPPNAGDISVTGGLFPIDLKVDPTAHTYPSLSDTSSF